jgi:hypothetical protein
MSDLDSPFSPYPKEKLLLNLESDRAKIENIIEKIQGLLTTSTYSKEKNFSCLGAAIAAGYSVLSGSGGGRLIALTCSNCIKGYGSSKIRDSLNLYNTENEKDLYTPQV